MENVGAWMGERMIKAKHPNTTAATHKMSMMPASAKMMTKQTFKIGQCPKLGLFPTIFIQEPTSNMDVVPWSVD